MTLLIRKAQLADAPELAEVHIRTRQHAYRGLLPSDFLARLSIDRRTTQWKEWLTQPSSNLAVFVAIVDGKVSGFSWVCSARGDDDKSTGELFAIYVMPESQGKGIGSRLIEKGEDYLQSAGFSEMILWVLAKIEPSLRFYENRGWKTDGSTKVQKW
jgi:ribosomal protein S18 acetylase RimI-like enzyme